MSRRPAGAGPVTACCAADADSAGAAAGPARRRIRSYVRREGRITPAQRRALDELLPRYGAGPLDGELDLEALFGRRAPVVLEIGSGNGELLASLAEGNPERNYLAVEVYRPGVGSLLQRVEARRLDNVRVAWADAVDVLERALPPSSLEAVLVLFPDPWPKKRHHKRRLVQPRLVNLVARRLAPGGILRVATDWEEYAQWIGEVLEGEPLLEPVAAESVEPLPVTRYQERGTRLGHGVREFIRRRRA